jgi:hypothetical protein
MNKHITNIAPSQEQSNKNNKNLLESCHSVEKKTRKAALRILFGKRGATTFRNSIPNMARDAEISTRTMRRCLNEFSDAQMIAWTPTQWRTNTYRLLPAFFEHPFIKQLMKTFAGLSLALLMAGCWAKSDQDGIGRLYFNSKEYRNRSLYRNSIVEGEDYSLLNTIDPGFVKKDRNEDEPIKKRVIMVMEDEKTKRQLLKQLPLTEHGIINLCKYSLATLRYAITKLYAVVHAQEPFFYLLKLCEKYSKENNQYVNRLWYDLQRQKGKILITDTNFSYPVGFELLKSRYPKKEYPRTKPSVPAPASHNGIATADFSLTQDQLRRIDDKLSEDMRFVNTAIDSSNPGYYMLIDIQNRMRERLISEGHLPIAVP